MVLVSHLHCRTENTPDHNWEEGMGWKTVAFWEFVYLSFLRYTKRIITMASSLRVLDSVSHVMWKRSP